MRPWAFTLIEVMVVVALLGLLAGATAWSLAEDVRRSSRAGVIGQVIHADALARRAARRSGAPCTLRFDLDQQRIGRAPARPGEAGELLPAAALPAGCRLERVVLADADALAADGAGRSGAADVTYSTDGRSVSYFVRLRWERDPPGDAPPDGAGAPRRGNSAWIVFAGLTGQATLLYEDGEVDNLLALLAPERADAH